MRTDWYEDSLRVTEAEPLVAYILSGVRMDPVALAERVDEFRAFIAQEMESGGGVIEIGKESGMFVMRKP